MNERYYAEMEAARNEALDAYFKARPQLMQTIAEETLFRAGFERGFQANWREGHVADSANEQRGET